MTKGVCMQIFKPIDKTNLKNCGNLTQKVMYTSCYSPFQWILFAGIALSSVESEFYTLICLFHSHVMH